VFYWSDHTMRYWAISDLNADALKSFSRLIQEQAATGRVTPAARGLPGAEDMR
jgi:hypothetical protein